MRFEDAAVNGGNAQIAGAAGRFGQRVLSGSFLPFPLAPVRQEGARSGHPRKQVAEASVRRYADEHHRFREQPASAFTRAES